MNWFLKGETSNKLNTGRINFWLQKRHVYVTCHLTFRNVDYERQSVFNFLMMGSCYRINSTIEHESTLYGGDVESILLKQTLIGILAVINSWNLRLMISAGVVHRKYCQREVVLLRLDSFNIILLGVESSAGWMKATLNISFWTLSGFYINIRRH